MHFHTHYDTVSQLPTKAIKPLFDTNNAAYRVLRLQDATRRDVPPPHLSLIPASREDTDSYTLSYVQRNLVDSESRPVQFSWHHNSLKESLRFLKFTDNSCLIIGDTDRRSDAQFIVPWGFSYYDKNEDILNQDMLEIYNAFQSARPLLIQKHIFRKCEQGKSAYPFFIHTGPGVKSQHTLSEMAQKIALWVRDTLNEGQDTSLIIQGRSVSMQGKVSPIKARLSKSKLSNFSDRPEIRAVERRIEGLFDGPDPVIKFSEQLAHDGLKAKDIANILAMQNAKLIKAGKPASSHEHIEMMGEMNAIFGDLVPS